MKLSAIFSFFSKIFSKILRKKTKPLVGYNHHFALLQKVEGKKIPRFAQLQHLKKILSPLERRILRFCLLFFCIGVVWFGLIARQEYRTAVPDYGGRYAEAIVGSPEFVNPIFSSLNEVDVDITRLVFSGLMRHDKDQVLVPDLAANYTISDDKKIYTVKLREDVYWHDGEPFTARDVLFTFDAIKNRKTNSPLYISFQGVAVEMLDDYTIVFTLKKPFQPFLSTLTVGILPEHVWSSIPVEQYHLTQLNLQPIGTGPFVFEELAKDETGFVFRYQLKRNEAYYDALAFLEKVVFRFFGEYETDLGAIHALRQKKVDGLHFVPSHLKDQVKRKHVNIHTLQLPQYTALFFNEKSNDFLGKKNVRKALGYALDKERILRETLGGEGRILYGPILPGFPGFDDGLEKTPYNVEEANVFLDAYSKKINASDYREERVAYYKKQYEMETEQEEEVSSEEVSSGDVVESPTSTESAVDLLEQEKQQGEEIARLVDQEVSDTQLFYRKSKEGELLTLRLVTAHTEEYRNAAERIAGFWQELGIKTDIEYVDPKNMSQEVLKERDFDVLLYGIILGNDPDQFPFWHSSQVSHPGLNLAQYVNRSVDTTLDSIRVESDPEKTQVLYKQLQDAIIEDIPAIFLYTPIYRYATAEDVYGISLERIFHPADRFAGITGWYKKTKGQWSFNKTN